jgi:mono/diheme cytochrome c family protein
MRKQLLIAILLLTGISAPSAEENDGVLALGRYMVTIGGCNDCHTAGFLPSEGQVPESQWLLGDRLGWHGPWGTTYATNLRLLVADMTEDQWMIMARNLRARPPMPWWKLHLMKESELKAIYAFLRHLGPSGEPAPTYLPPGQQPPQPYASFPSP